MSLCKTLLLALSTLAASVPTGPAEVSRINLPNVGFASLVDKSLFLSTFSGAPGSKDYEYVINAQDLVGKKSASATKLDGSVTWPNTVTKTPSQLFGGDGVVIAGGFLVPGKSNGGIWYVPVVDGKPGAMINLFQASGFFYHRVLFYDVNQDGKMDMITCRASKSLFGSGSGALTWLEPLDRANPLGKWKETVIGKGCDTFFILEDVNGTNFLLIIRRWKD
jgi:hypothetical protein